MLLAANLQKFTAIFPALPPAPVHPPLVLGIDHEQCRCYAGWEFPLFAKIHFQLPVSGGGEEAGLHSCTPLATNTISAF